MKNVTLSKSQIYYLQTTDTEITISAGAGVTVTIQPPIPYTINRQLVLRLLPAQTVVLKLNARNWEISQGSTQENTIPPLEAGKFLSNDGVRLLWDTVISGVTSVFGRTGAVVAEAGDYNAGQITYTPPTTMTATDVQTAVDDLVKLTPASRLYLFNNFT